MLDAIVCPNWGSRYFSFNASWSAAEEMASMRNGQGDEWFLLFGPFGAALKGLAHECALARGGTFAAEIQQRVPASFSSFLSEAAFSMDWASFCYWRSSEDPTWHKVFHPDPKLAGSEDGSVEYLAPLVEPASHYQEFANDYFEIDLPLAAIEHIYAQNPLTEELISLLNPELSFAEAEESAIEIGYPLQRKDA